LSFRSFSRGRIPALDALRGIAILLVLALHLTRPGPGLPMWPVVITNSGWLGVDLFFTLSGFLITGILLEAKGRPDYFGRFYGRRARRILPLSLAVLGFLYFVAPALSEPSACATAEYRSTPWWWWLFASNWYGGWGATSARFIPTVAHFWSLAIEEQFYLVWPFVVLWCAPRRLASVCIVVAVGSVVMRAALLAAGAEPVFVYHSTLTRLDGLAVGALAAVALSSPAWRETALLWARRVVRPVGAILAAVVVVTFGLRDHVLMQLVGYSAAAVCGVALVVVAAADPSSAISVWLARARGLQRVGVVSYGLYILHAPIIDLANAHGWSASRLAVSWRSAALAQVAWYLVIGGGSYLLALASWRWLERPLLEARVRAQPWREEERRAA